MEPDDAKTLTVVLEQNSKALPRSHTVDLRL